MSRFAMDCLCLLRLQLLQSLLLLNMLVKSVLNKRVVPLNPILFRKLLPHLASDSLLQRRHQRTIVNARF